MLFNSFDYALFFPAVVLLYFAIPQRWRWALLLAASYYFYAAWRAEYLVLIVISTLIDYGVGLQLGRARRESTRRLLLIASLSTNLGILFLFKYFNLFNDSLRAVFNSVNLFYDVPALAWLLPVGISFYTFQSMSYSIDVFRGQQAPERHLGIFALYVAFFPQLVAGPIERSTQLLPQFYQRIDFDSERISSGLRLIAWGLFKKVVIADRLAFFVNSVYSSPSEQSGAAFLVATYFFAFQILCDFSGYSDIAIGSARVLGIDLMTNFRRPYLSLSVAEFWRRWHISLSTWFRDYLYIPLGGSRVGQGRWAFNILVVFVVSGLWHGAAWTFVIWGALHGLYLLVGAALGRFTREISGWLWRTLSFFVTFHAVCFAWIFFRANSLADAGYIIAHLLTNLDFRSYVDALSTGESVEFALSIGLILFLLGIQLAEETVGLATRFPRLPAPVRWGVYYAGAMSIFLLGVRGNEAFIYFQF